MSAGLRRELGREPGLLYAYCTFAHTSFNDFIGVGSFEGRLQMQKTDI